MNPKVSAVLPQAGHQLLLTFTNAEQRLFDLRPYLDKGVFRQLQDPVVFNQARVVAGSVEWPGEIDLSFDTLYLRSRAVTPASASAG